MLQVQLFCFYFLGQHQANKRQNYSNLTQILNSLRYNFLAGNGKLKVLTQTFPYKSVELICGERDQHRQR